MGDDWRRGTMDTTMGGKERGQNDRWKVKTQLGQHRYFDAGRCKDGESNAGYGQEWCKALGPLLLGQLRSRVYRSHAVAEEEYGVYQIR